jgi:hypothetical protein
MPLDPDKLREVTEKAQTLSKRFDAFMERRRADSDDDDDDEDEDEDIDLDPSEETSLVDPAEEAMLLTPGIDLTPSDPPDDKEPWYK